MNRFVRIVPLLFLPLMLASCDSMTPDRAEGDSPTLLPIHYTYNDISDGVYRDLVIDGRGDAHIIQTRGSGPNDVTRVGGLITQEERTALLSAFKGWKKLDKFYPTDVSPQYEITYGGYAVMTSNLDKVPHNFVQAKAELDRITATLFKLANEKTAAAAAAATRAAENAAPPQTELPSALPTPR